MNRQMENRQTNKMINGQMDEPKMDKYSDRPTNKQNSELTDQQTNKLTDKQVH